VANTKTFLGLIAGAAIGAIAYILVTPGIGTAARRKIADKPGDWKATTTDSFTGWLERLQQAIDKEVKK